MRIIFSVFMVLCIVFFAVGWISVIFKWIDAADYIVWVGLVGSLASVVGLSGMTRPTITSSDIKAIELDAIKLTLEQYEELEMLKKKHESTKTEVTSLEEQRKNLEQSIRRVALNLYLREKRERVESELIERVEADKEISNRLDILQKIDKELDQSEIDVKSDANYASLLKIVENYEDKKEQGVVKISVELLPFVRGIVVFDKVIKSAFSSLGLKV